MVITKRFVDGLGKTFEATCTIDEDDKLARAILDLANRVRRSTGGKAASALGGAVRVTVKEIPSEVLP